MLMYYKIVLIEPPYHCSTGWFAAAELSLRGPKLFQIMLVDKNLPGIKRNQGITKMLMELES